MKYTVRNLEYPLMDTEIEGTLRQAIYVKVGMLNLHPGDRIIIEDADGYIVPLREQKKWYANIITSGGL